MTKQIRSLTFLLALVLVSCVSPLDFVITETTSITVTLTVIPILTETLTLNPSATPSPSATPFAEPTPTETPLPFAGFRDLFRLFRTWYAEDKTFFYFLNAGIEDKLYATADEFELECQPDPKFPVQMICVYDGIIEGRTIMDFRFFTTMRAQYRSLKPATMQTWWMIPSITTNSTALIVAKMSSALRNIVSMMAFVTMLTPVTMPAGFITPRTICLKCIMNFRVSLLRVSE